jgi:spore coat polysaccharide biosynthesis protein SpsF
LNKLGKIGVIVSARMNSSRLAQKAILQLSGVPMISFLLKRLKTSCKADEIILATSYLNQDDPLEQIAKEESVKCFRGSLDDVVERYVEAAAAFDIDTVARVTGDCPFVNGEIIDYAAKAASNFEFDLCTTKGHFPVGLDVEIYHAKAMKKAHMSTLLNRDHREHLTLHYYQDNKKYNVVSLIPKPEWTNKNIHYTVDVLDDLEKANSITKNFNDINFTIADLIDLSG